MKAKKTRAASTSSTRSKGAGRKPQVAAKTWQPKFLDEFRKRAIVKDACKVAGIARDTAYKARESDPEFAAQWKLAKDDATDAVRREIWRRGKEGVSEPIFYKGEQVATIKRYSEGLLTLLAKALAPEEFRERNDAVNVNLDFSNLTNEQVERLARGEDVRAVLASPGTSGIGTPAAAEPTSGDRPLGAETPE